MLVEGLAGFGVYDFDGEVHFLLALSADDGVDAISEGSVCCSRQTQAEDKQKE